MMKNKKVKIPLQKMIAFCMCLIMVLSSPLQTFGASKKYISDVKIKNFTYYEPVTCNRKEGGFETKETAILGDFGDLKGDIGKEWLALFYTTDERAGDPITTDIVLQSDSKLKEGNYLPLSMFGSGELANLNSREYIYGSNDALYMMFRADDKANLAGSIFAGNNVMYMAVLAGAVAVVAAVVVTRKRKMKEI